MGEGPRGFFPRKLRTPARETLWGFLYRYFAEVINSPKASHHIRTVL